MAKLFNKLRDCMWWCRNVLRFRKALWQYRPWDNEYGYYLLHTHLETVEEALTQDKWHVNVVSNLRHIRTCKVLVERILEDAYIFMYYDYTEDKNTLFGFRSERRPLVPNSFEPMYQKKADIQYLHKLLAKHGEGWWT